jgi:hypothetical protein
MSLSKHLKDVKQNGMPIKAISRAVLGVNTEILLDAWLSIYIHNVEYRGKAETIKYMKALYGQATSYSLFQKLPHIPFRKTLKCGLVKDLKPFKPYLRGSIPRTRAALLVLRQFEMLYVEPSYDISTVTDPCTTTSRWHRWAFTRWMKTTRRKLPVISISKPEDHQTSKKGPSSLPAMTSWDVDLLSLPQHLIESICRLSELFGDSEIRLRIENLMKLLISKDTPNDRKCHSRIQVFPSGGGKTRIIAIYDYWTQRTLRAPHRAIFKNLRKIQEDATYSHASAADWLKTVPSNIDVYCYDLTAATDRIPYWIHDIVLKQHLQDVENRDEIATLIKDLLINRPFKLSWDPSQEVYYECGQPMGAYSSWALLAYSHHCIARYCGARRNEYRIIGDDIVILGKAGLKYRKFMTAIGVQISESKSIISYRNDKHRVGEVAKRLILDGFEVSPPTANLIAKSFRDWRLGPMLFEDMVRRGWELQASSFMEVADSLYSENWKEKLLTVLSFPLTSGKSALIQGVTDTFSVWKEWDKTELAILFVRYRLVLLDNTGQKFSREFPIQFLIGLPPVDADPDIYALSPERSVRQYMSKRIIHVQRIFEDTAIALAKYGADKVDIPEIQDEELFYPDMNFKFLEKKYQRQRYLSNTLVNFKRMLDNGTLQSYLDNAPSLL